MRRAGAALMLAVFALTGCVNVHRETRVERGPVLRAYERQVPIEGGGILAHVDAKWPKLTLRFEQFEMCRRERVEEVVQERITEAHAPSAGPSFALGVTGTVIGGGLFALQGAFSDQPNTRYIDETGRYGPSPRTVATGWSYVLLAVGVPALVTGIIGLSQSGETVQQNKVEQVASALETPCKESPAEGQVELVRAAGEGPESITVSTTQGQVSLTAGQLRDMRLASVQMNGQLVLLPEEEAMELGAFLACNEILPPPSPAGLARLSEQALVTAYNTARQCEPVGGAAGKEAVEAFAAEIQRRRAGAPGPELPAGPVPQSYEAAVEAYRPALRFAPGSADLSKLSTPAALQGQAATFSGTVEQAEAGRLLLDVGGQKLRVEVPEGAPYRAGFAAGVRVEGVGVLAGEEAAAPVIRAVWLRADM